VTRARAEVDASRDERSAFTRATDDRWRERLAAETDESREEESRLKAGCSQDWLPHKRPSDNRPQVNNLPHKATYNWNNG
jgi:hypothetical protein